MKSLEKRNASWKTNCGTTSTYAHKEFDRELRESAKLAFSKTFESGDLVVAQGSKCSSVFFVVRGSVDFIVTIQGTQTELASQFTMPSHSHTKEFTMDNTKDNSGSLEERKIRFFETGLSQTSYNHNGRFHSKLITQCINGSVESPYEASLPQSANKLDESHTKNILHQIPFHPRPPLMHHEGICSPRTRQFVQKPKSPRKVQRTFRLKTGMGGNIMGL